MRIEPPWSPPIAIGTSPAATTAPLPDDEPPAEKPIRRGLWTGPGGEGGVPARKGRGGVVAAREAEILACGLADDRPARVQNAGDDRRVQIRHVARERRG